MDTHEEEEETDSNKSSEDIDFTSSSNLSFTESCLCRIKLLLVFLYKFTVTFRRHWFYLLRPTIAIIAIFSFSCLLLRHKYPWKGPGELKEHVPNPIDKDWLSTTYPEMNGVLLVGYAPHIPVIDAVMEEVERILVRNGLPPKILEFQVVPFISEYTMSQFIHKHPGVLRYAFAFDVSVAERMHSRLHPKLNLYSYIYDWNGGVINNESSHPGDVYIAQVIMEAFINAHTKNENNISISYVLTSTNPKREDPIFEVAALHGLEDIYIVCVTLVVWILVYHISWERENTLHVTLNRMGVSEAYNIIAGIITWYPYVLTILTLMGMILVIPLNGNIPILSQSSYGPLFVFLITYSLSLLAYCELGSTIFETAQQCVMLTCSLLYIGVYLDSYWAAPTYLRQCLLLVMAGSQKGLLVILQLEEYAHGLHWNNTHLVAEVSPPAQPIENQMILLLVSVPVQLILASLVVYVKAPTRPLWFQKLLFRHRPLRNSKLGYKQDFTQYELDTDYSKSPCLEFENVFTEGVRPLYDINMVVKKDEIVVAVGLDSSGILAILRIIYGESNLAFGTAKVFDLDCTKHTRAILRNTGVCRQNRRALFNRLTVRENLWIFLQLKQICQQREKDNTDSLIKSAQLECVLDTQVSQLTPEDSAALNVALAFLGDSKLIILEHPTKDMNVQTKMRIWNLIRQQSEGRSVLLSTLSMEEAETIGDRITIFHDGYIHCCGSVHFLRRLFGTGYYLAIDKQKNASAEDVKMVCSYYCPTSVCLKQSQHKLQFLLPTTKGGDFMVNLLNSIEKNQTKLGIINYDVQGSTLVNTYADFTSGVNVCPDPNANDLTGECRSVLSTRFGIGPDCNDDNTVDDKRSVDTVQSNALPDTKVVEKSYLNKEKEEELIESSTAISYSELESKVTDDVNERLERLTGIRLYVYQLKTLIAARFLASSRNLPTELLQAFIIVLLTLFFKSYMALDMPHGEVRADHRRKPDKFCPSFDSLVVAEKTEGMDKDPRVIRLATHLENVHRDAEMTCSKHDMSFEENMQEQLITHSYIHGLPHYGIELTPSKDNLLSATLYVTRNRQFKSIVPAMCATMEAFLRYVTNDTEQKHEINYKVIFPPPTHFVGEYMRIGSILMIAFMLVPYHIIKRRGICSSIVHQITGVGPARTWIANFISDMFSYIFFSIIFYLVCDFKNTQFPRGGEEGVATVITIALLYGALMLFHVYCIQMMFRNAWFGTAAVLVTLFVSSELLLRYQVGTTVNEDTKPLELNRLYLMLPASIMPAFIHSERHNLGVSYHCPEADRHCDNEANTDRCCYKFMQKINMSEDIYLLIEIIHLFVWIGLLTILEYRLYRHPYRWIKLNVFKVRDTPFGSKLIGQTLPLQSPLATFTAILDTVSGSPSAKHPSKQKASGLFSSAVDETRPAGETSKGQRTEMKKTDMRDPPMTVNDSENGNPQNEVHANMQSNLGMTEDNLDKDADSGDSQLVIEHLTKQPHLKDINIKVNSGEIICFISAKQETTSEVLNCICGWSSYQSGRILFKGQPIGLKNPRSSVSIGMCARENFTSIMTPKNSLAYYCKLRGVVNVRKEVINTIKMLKLENYLNADPAKLSDSVQTKFRVARAIVGEPDVILLDQPLTSLDTVSKVTVMSAIARLKGRGKVVIMTSNSIDACASLASQLAIMVGGQLVFVASPNQIRKTFSNSYSLSARIDPREHNFFINVLIPSLLQRFPHSQIYVDSLSYLQILLPFKTDSLSEIFQLMESVKKHTKTSDFILRHATMDSIINVLEESHDNEDASTLNLASS